MGSSGVSYLKKYRKTSYPSESKCITLDHFGRATPLSKERIWREKAWKRIESRMADLPGRESCR